MQNSTDTPESDILSNRSDRDRIFDVSIPKLISAYDFFQSIKPYLEPTPYYGDYNPWEKVPVRNIPSTTIQELATKGEPYGPFYDIFSKSADTLSARAKEWCGIFDLAPELSKLVMRPERAAALRIPASIRDPFFREVHGVAYAINEALRPIPESHGGNPAIDNTVKKLEMILQDIDTASSIVQAKILGNALCVAASEFSDLFNWWGSYGHKLSYSTHWENFLKLLPASREGDSVEYRVTNIGVEPARIKAIKKKKKRSFLPWTGK